MSKIFHDPANKQINYLDERFYTKDNEVFYPSVTTVLSVYPKGFGFNQWLKDLGMNADDVMNRAAESGSRVHDAIDKFLRGEELLWTTEAGKEIYSFEEWMMILKFHDFWKTYSPKVLAHELPLVSDTLRVGGTFDLVCKIKNVDVEEIWLIDYKTSGGVYKTHELQLSAYAEMWNEANPELKIERSGIMHLKAFTKGADKTGKCIQGKGWKLNEFDRSQEEAFKIFEMTHAIWDEENPNYKPKNMIYPDRIRIEDGAETPNIPDGREV